MITIEHAKERVREAGGEELLERLEHLDRTRDERRGQGRGAANDPHGGGGGRPPDRGARSDFDVVIAGGGLSLLIAPLLAARGLRVAVVDRARIGATHREWNASGPELQRLVEGGLFTTEEVAELVVARYSRGVCRWYGGGSYPVTGVLDHAVDAGGLLAATRAQAEARGVRLLDFHELAGHTEGSSGVALRVKTPAGGALALSARVLVDARGAASPYASADLLCPTVGGVISGLEQGDGEDQIRADEGEILATTEHVEEGRQHLWEAFPGRMGETTVYLFYYAKAADVGSGSLLRLYARFFDRLGRYKRGEGRLIQPTFGYIPGWSRLGPAPAAPGPRVALVGDAAARHSPLTFCGFGAMLRSFAPAAEALARAASAETIHTHALASITHDAPIHAGTGALARLMAAPSRAPARAGEVNALLDDAFAVLHGMGNEAYAALLRDEMQMPDYVRFLRTVAARRPQVYREVVGLMGAIAVGRWGLSIGRELFRAS